MASSFLQKLNSVKVQLALGGSALAVGAHGYEYLSTFWETASMIKDLDTLSLVKEMRLNIVNNAMLNIGGIGTGYGLLRTADKYQLRKAGKLGSPGGKETPEVEVDADSPYEQADVKLQLRRYKSSNAGSVGVLSISGLREKLVFGIAEDPHRDTKVKGSTRIWEGDYWVQYNKENTPLTRRYKTDARTKNFFKWHLEIVGIDQFDQVYFHIGNDAGDTEGCPLTGFSVNFRTLQVQESALAYEELYVAVSKAIDQGKTVAIRIINEDLS